MLSGPCELTSVPWQSEVFAVGVDSGLIALVDSLRVDDLLKPLRRVLDGSEGLPGPRFASNEIGFVLDTGGDGSMGVAVQIKETRTTAIKVNLEGGCGPGDGCWIPASLIPCPSGALVLGDPGMLDQFVPDPFGPPYGSFGVWAVFSMPGPGWVAVHALKQFGAVEARNLAVHAAWLPA